MREGRSSGCASRSSWGCEVCAREEQDVPLSSGRLVHTAIAVNWDAEIGRRTGSWRAGAGVQRHWPGDQNMAVGIALYVLVASVTELDRPHR